jgi:hypothetical protein
MSEESSLEQSYRTLQRIEPNNARTVLGEAKKILDQLGVIFFLRQGTCLGVIRKKGFVPSFLTYTSSRVVFNI